MAGSSGKGSRGARQPWYIALADGSPLSFAALWERWDRSGDGLETFTIITTEACESLADIHHRQPAIIHPDRFGDWLDPASPSELTPRRGAQALCRPLRETPGQPAGEQRRQQ